MGKKKAKITVNLFYMSLHMGLCQGVANAIREVWAAGKIAWQGYKTSNSTNIIQNPELFGGSQKEGGLSGHAFFLLGDDAQTIGDYLAGKLGKTDATCPAFRQITSIFFTSPESDPNFTQNGFYWQANTPFLPTVKVRLERYPGLGVNAGELQWQPDLAKISRFSTLSSVPTPVAKHSSGWKYLVEAWNTVGSDYSDPDYDDSSWSIGSAPFYFKFPHPSGEINNWGIGGGGTDIGTNADVWMRREITAEIGSTLRINVAHDNTASIWIDGVALSLTAIGSFTSYAEHVVTSSPMTLVAFINETQAPSGSNYTFADVEVLIPAEAYDANPAHMILDALTSPLYGAGISMSEIDEQSFIDAATTLYDEGFGLSMKWTRETAVSSIINEILDHIDATLFLDPTTGLLTLKLIRDDYVVGNLRVIDESSAQLTGFERKALGELVNEIEVTWTDPSTEKDATTPAIIDLGLRAAQGAPISDGRNFYGIRNAALAMKAGYRELLSASTPLATAELQLDRRHWDIVPGEAFVLNWTERGISQLVMRCLDIDYGEPKRSPIRINAIEDKFGLDDAVFEEPPSSEWVDPSADPTAADFTLVFTLPYYMLVNEIDNGIDATYPSVAAGILAAEDTDDASSYNLYAEIADSLGNLDFESVGVKSFVAYGTLDAVFDQEVSTVMTTIDLTPGPSPAVGSIVVLGDGDETENEICVVSAVDTAASPPTWTLQRGCLDTTPKTWPIGTPFWVIDAGSIFTDDTEWSDAGSSKYKILTITSLGTLAEADAPVVTTTMTGRPYYPLRPANVSVNGTYFGEHDATQGSPNEVFVDWATRNRVTEDAIILAWDDADVTEEAGQTTTVTIMRESDRTVLATHDAVSAPYQVPASDYAGETKIIVRVTSKRDGYESLQGHEITVVVGGGLQLQTGQFVTLQSGQQLELNA